MKKLITIINIIILSSNIFAQNNIDTVLAQVEKNNTQLLALRKSIEAEKIGNKTGIYLQNPEIGFNYLWGSPSDIGNRADISITQTFDFPTAYGYKKQISNIKNEQVELEYQKQKIALFLQTRNLCYDLIYTNALRYELSKRLVHAQDIANSFKAKFEIGETNILEYNKSQLNLLNIKTELESVDIERIALLSELSSLNGGIPIDFDNTVFQTQLIVLNFEDWYLLAEQNNPILNWLKQEIDISQRQIKLNKAMRLPKLQAGYMSEGLFGVYFQGLTIGLSIPLWENKNTVKYAKANTLALESIESDNKAQFYNRLKTLHTKAIGLQKNINVYGTDLQKFNNSKLLKKALDKGEISLIDYILELSFYYESVNNLLEKERDLNKTLVELNQYM
ncbi:MAG: transporter [Bacteroidetes bacterium]|nr:MAG: transporter [Bacteroidota bacterium]